MSQRLPRRIGHARALEMMISCRPYDAAEAAAMGLVNRCMPAGALDEAVGELAEAILANSWHSNAENKRLIYSTDGMRLSEGLDHEIMRNAGFDRDAAARRQSFHDRPRGGTSWVGPGRPARRSEGRRVGKEGVGTCRWRWSPSH